MRRNSTSPSCPRMSPCMATCHVPAQQPSKSRILLFLPRNRREGGAQGPPPGAQKFFCSISHRQGDALQSCRRTHFIFLSPKAQVSKIGLFKDCIKTPFLELIQGHEAQAVPPGPGGWYGQNLRTNPHGVVPRTEQLVASTDQLCLGKAFCDQRACV